MKTKLLLLSLLACGHLAAQVPQPPADGQASAPPRITLAWDLNEPAPSGYYLYFGPVGGEFTGRVDVPHNPVDLAGVLAITHPIDLDWATEYRFVATAYNRTPDGEAESGPSNEVTYTTGPEPDVPGAPQGLRVTVTVETSANMQDWLPIASVEHVAESDDSSFYRVRVDRVPQ